MMRLRRAGAFALFLGAAAVLRARDGLGDAVALYDAREYSAARAAFLQLYTNSPEDPALNFYLGRIALWFDDEPAALAHLQRGAEIAPNSARLQNALGDAYGLAAQNANVFAKLGWARKCRAAYERAIALEPQNPAFRWSLLGYCVVAPRLAGGGFDQARAQADAIVALDPMSGHIARATLALAEKRFDAAFAEFDQPLRANPDDFIALYQVGRCSALSGRQVERGLAALRRCLELPPPAGDGQPTHACVHYRLGNLLVRAGDPAGAQREYAAAQRLHPDFRAQKIALRN